MVRLGSAEHDTGSRRVFLRGTQWGFRNALFFLGRVGFFRGNPILEHEARNLDQTEASATFSHNLDLIKGQRALVILLDWSVEMVLYIFSATTWKRNVFDAQRERCHKRFGILIFRTDM